MPRGRAPAGGSGSSPFPSRQLCTGSCPEIKAKLLVHVLLVCLGHSGFKRALSYEANELRGCSVANTTSCFRGRQSSASFGTRWSCGQQQAEEGCCGRADGRGSQQLHILRRGMGRSAGISPAPKSRHRLAEGIFLTSILYGGRIARAVRVSQALSQYPGEQEQGAVKCSMADSHPLSSCVILLENRNCLNNGTAPMELCSDAEGARKGYFPSCRYFSPPASPPERGWNPQGRRRQHQPGPVAFLNGENEIKRN